MIVFLCPECFLAVRVTGDRAEVDTLVGSGHDNWPDSYTCPVCSFIGMEGMLESEAPRESLQQAKVLTAQEFFSALNGLGFPEERSCSERVVRELFKQKVISVNGFPVRGSTRFVIRFIDFEDGTRMFFESSTNGATVHRIRAPLSYTKQATNDLPRASSRKQIRTNGTTISLCSGVRKRP